MWRIWSVFKGTIDIVDSLSGFMTVTEYSAGFLWSKPGFHGCVWFIGRLSARFDQTTCCHSSGNGRLVVTLLLWGSGHISTLH